MKLIFCILSFLLALSCQVSATDNDEWADTSERSPELEKLASLEGNWKLKLKAWRGNNKNPDFFSGKANLSWELDKRILVNRLKVTSLSLDYQGFGSIAYNSSQKEFVSTWSDTRAPGIFKASGPYNEETKTILFKGLEENPETKEKVELLSEIKIETADKFRIIFSLKEKEDPKKLAEFIYTRKK